MEAGEADCVRLCAVILAVVRGGQRGRLVGLTGCHSSTVTKDGQGNEHLMIQFNVSDGAIPKRLRRVKDAWLTAGAGSRP